jgi:exopolyphosphatase/guanosine-5'-triphosphate,3'-diphosphate pyrophosphatase
VAALRTHDGGTSGGSGSGGGGAGAGAGRRRADEARAGPAVGLPWPRAETQRMVPLAAMDIGSNAVRMAVALSRPDGGLERGEYLRVPVRLGTDVFRSGRVSEAALQRLLDALLVFKRMTARYPAGLVRVCATSAMRDAQNAALVVDRVRRETGLVIETISGVEEARLVGRAVAQRMDLDKRSAMVDVGGGSTEISCAEHDEILWCETFNVGAVRLLAAFARLGRPEKKSARLMEDFLGTLAPAIEDRFQGRGVERLVATGGNIETLADLLRRRRPEDAPAEDKPVDVIEVRALKDLHKRLRETPARERAARFGLRADRADVIVPASFIYWKVAKLLGQEAIHVPHVGLLDGILLELEQRAWPKRGGLEGRARQVRVSALVQGRRFHFDERHARTTADVALMLFDALRTLHRLGERERMLLEAAALLHDVGSYVSRSRHHRHSQYLISQLDLVGLDQRERLLVANVARYHRKGMPSPAHENFRDLAPDERLLVQKLASLLRVADALDRGQGAVAARDVRVTRTDGRVELRVPSAADLLLETWSVEQRQDLFEETFGLQVRLRRVRPRRAPRPRRAAAKRRR